MNRSLTVLAISVLSEMLFTACDSRKIARLEHMNDSLRNEIQKRDQVIAAIENAHRILDSIGLTNEKDQHSREVHEKVASRLRAIVEHIRNSEKELGLIQKQLRSSENEAFAYLMLVDALKGEVGIRDGEIEGLVDSVIRFQMDYEGVYQNLQLTENKVQEFLQKIEMKEKELADLKVQVKDHARNAEAEAYYARAKHVEQSADKIKFAPSKKRVTYQEALELYKKSYALGKKEAYANISSLQKEVEGTHLTAELTTDDESKLK